MLVAIATQLITFRSYFLDQLHQHNVSVPRRAVELWFPRRNCVAIPSSSRLVSYESKVWRYAPGEAPYPRSARISRRFAYLTICTQGSKGACSRNGLEYAHQPTQLISQSAGVRRLESSEFRVLPDVRLNKQVCQR